MTDIYSSSGDPDLASMSNTTKQLTMCGDHPSMPKEWFHPQSRQTHCAQCLVDKQIDKQDCMEARTYCTKMM